MKSLLKRLLPTSIRTPVLDGYHAIMNQVVCHRVLHRKERFSFAGQSFRYFSHHFNHTYFNERIIEIPIALSYLEKYAGRRVLEVGNVLSHYGAFSHTVVDKYEKAPGVVNADILDYAPAYPFDLIISISTYEHIGYDENRYANQGQYSAERDNLLRALACTKRLLAPGGVFLLTAPLGYNPALDELVYRDQLGLTTALFMKRMTRDNRWAEVPLTEVRGSRYGAPFRPGANGLLIARYDNP